MKSSKRFRELQLKVEKQKLYNLGDAIKLIKELSTANFDETVELSVKLGIDPKKDHVRGTTTLPHGVGKTKRILVLTEGAKVDDAKMAGADFIGGDDYLKRIQDGWLDFDVIIATPDIMPKVSKLGKILGPRGLMPNPKVGTVTQEVGKAVKETKKGKIEFKSDKTGSIHHAIGKSSFESSKLEANTIHLLKEILEVKPPGVKSAYFKSIYLSSTMGPSVRVDPKSSIV